MAQQPLNPNRPNLDLRGAVDLSSLAPRRPAAGGAGGANGNGAGAPAGGGTFVIETSDTSFAADVMERSQVVPVVLDLVSGRAPTGQQVTSVLEQLTDQLDGRIVLAKIDVDANPQLVATLQVQGIPSVFAVIGGQLMVLFQGVLPPQEIQSHLARLLQAAAQYGVTGRLTPEDMGTPDEGIVGEPEEEPLPPLHQAAYDAIERDDLDAAIAAYEQALLEAPADDLARVGLAQVKLMARTRDADLDAARAAAAADPADVQAQILVADLDVLGGHVEDAFARLVDTVRVTSGEDRDTVRAHLIELFEVVGAEDPRVPKARLALANALF